MDELECAAQRGIGSLEIPFGERELSRRHGEALTVVFVLDVGDGPGGSEGCCGFLERSGVHGGAGTVHIGPVQLGVVRAELNRCAFQTLLRQVAE